MAEFHFLRPWWLAALPLGVWLIWQLTCGARAGGRWRTWVDEALQPFVLTGLDSSLGERRWQVVGAVIAWVLAAVALAGPTWQRLAVPAYRSDEALVVAMDLSRSMDAADLQPTRLERAKLKLLSLLERREAGQTALVVFSAHAFTVTPLTTDTRTISSLVSSLSSDIMPSRGSYPEAGLRKAAELLRQTGLSRGQILLVTDTNVSPRVLDTASELNGKGFAVSVLGVGSAEGGPITLPDGGFLTDGRGQVVIPKLDAEGLRRLASAGGGRYATLGADEEDLDRLFPPEPAAGEVMADSEERFEAEVWQDEGLWLVLGVLPLLALAFRRGWVVVIVLWSTLPAPEAQALEWIDLWQRADQRGYAALQAQQPEQAAELFDDPEWRAAAQYRSGDYQGSATSLRGMDTPDGQYNRGNALARTGNFEAAIEAYDRALELDPEHEDAAYNRDLLLQKQPPPQESAEQANSQSGDPQSSESQQQDSSNRSDQGQDASERQPQENLDPSDQQDGAEAEPRLGEERDEEGELGLSPDDLEEWASEQAAEQWLRRIPQDPGGLLRRKFLYQYQRLGVDQDGNYVWPGDEEEPF